MKKVVFLLLTLLLICLSSKADNTNKVTVGLTIDSTAVVAESQSFGRRIEDVTIQSGLDYMLLKFRETTKSGKWLQSKGEIGAYSIRIASCCGRIHLITQIHPPIAQRLEWVSPKGISSRCWIRIRVVSGGKASLRPFRLMILPIS